MRPPHQPSRPAPASPLAPETAEQKEARIAAANKAIQEVCKRFGVAFHVPSLDISSGKIWPVISLLATDKPQ
jgi:hypothetical protein